MRQLSRHCRGRDYLSAFFLYQHKRHFNSFSSLFALSPRSLSSPHGISCAELNLWFLEIASLWASRKSDRLLICAMCAPNRRPTKAGHKCTYQLTFIAASCEINQAHEKFHSSDISIYELAVDSAPRAPKEYFFIIMFRKRVYTQQISINIYSMLI